MFLYDPIAGLWFEAITVQPGSFAYAAGRWSPGWRTYLMDLNGDRRADVLAYDRDSGRWFQCLNTGFGGFSYTGGVWRPGLTILTTAPRTP